MNENEVWLKILTVAMRVRQGHVVDVWDMNQCIKRADEGLEAYKERFDGEKIKGGTA